MNAHSVIYPVKILITGQEVRKYPLFSLGRMGRRKKGTMGYNFGLDSEAQSCRVCNHGKGTGPGHVDWSQKQLKKPS